MSYISRLNFRSVLLLSFGLVSTTSFFTPSICSAAHPDEYSAMNAQPAADISALQALDPQIAEELRKEIELSAATIDPREQRRIEKLQAKQAKKERIESAKRQAALDKAARIEAKARHDRLKFESDERFHELDIWDHSERKLAEAHQIGFLNRFEATLEPILKILELKTAGVSSMKVGAKFLNELLKISKSDPRDPISKDSELWNLESRVSPIYNELINLKLPEPSKDDYYAAIKELEEQSQNSTDEFELNPAISSLLLDHFYYQKQWVQLKGGSVFGGAVFVFQLGASGGTIINSLGKRYWSIGPVAGATGGYGGAIQYTPVVGEFQGKHFDPKSLSTPVVPLFTKEKVIDGKLVARNQAAGIVFTSTPNNLDRMIVSSNRVYKLIKLHRDYTYLRRRLGILYLKIPAHLQGQLEAEITPLPFRRK